MSKSCKLEVLADFLMVSNLSTSSDAIVGMVPVLEDPSGPKSAPWHCLVNLLESPFSSTIPPVCRLRLLLCCFGAGLLNRSKSPFREQRDLLGLCFASFLLIIGGSPWCPCSGPMAGHVFGQCGASKLRDSKPSMISLRCSACTLQQEISLVTFFFQNWVDYMINLEQNESLTW